MNKVKNDRRNLAEPILWVILSLAAGVQHTSIWSAADILACTMFALKPEDLSEKKWRHSVLSDAIDPQGLCMMVILPLMLDSIVYCQQDPSLHIYATLFRILVLCCHAITRPLGVILATATVVMDKDVLCQKTIWAMSILTVLFVLHHRGRGLYGVFTVGEWFVSSGIVAVVTVEMMGNETEAYPLYGLVAATGMLGSGVACAVALLVSKETNDLATLIVRTIILLLVPIASIEATLSLNGYKEKTSKFLPWLISFIQEYENGNARAAWIGYWIIVLAVAIPLSPKSFNVVVARKWFHFVAVLLFGPVIMMCPQLMSLAFAVAISLLLLLENLRPYLPCPVQNFYKSFLHEAKDCHDQVIVTHLALIAGCAVPLWTAQMLRSESKLLPMFGVICLGVGDSMGALVGTYFGKTHWNSSQRTLEGSLAMLCSMAFSCHFVSDEPWFAAVTFVTLLEACTQQIDNFVLPLAGATVLVMQQCG